MNAQKVNETGKPGPRLRLRVLETTDLHMHVLPYDYFSDRPVDHFGLTLCARLIESLRNGPDLCLLFDNGDFLQGNPLADWIERNFKVGKDAPHPVIKAMNALEYDAGTLGNHDFNYGLGYLRATIAGAGFPIVSANLCTTQANDATNDVTVVPPWTILDRTCVGTDGTQYPIRIGVIGFAPPQTAVWERVAVAGALSSRDIVESAQTYVPIIRAQGADLVVALAHTGLGSGPHVPGSENAAAALAAVPGIDLVLAGHTHNVFPMAEGQADAPVDPAAGTLHGTPAVMAGFHGSHVGVIDLVLDLDPDGWSISQQQARTIPVTTVIGDAPNQTEAAVRRCIEDAHAGVVADSRQPVGRTTRALHSQFARVGPSTALAATAQALINYTLKALKGLPEAGLPLVAAVSPSRCGGQGGPDNYVDIATGPLIRRHAAELYLYTNSISILEMDGAGILAWLETSARQFLQITPGMSDQPLLDETVPGYMIDILYGLRYTIDPSRPPGQGRVSGVTLPNGRALTTEDRVILITNSYRASGGGGYPMAGQGRPVIEDMTALQDIILAHFQSGPVQADLSHPWTFVPLPGTSAWFDTGRGAIGHLHVFTDGPRVYDIGSVDSGFHRFRLDF